MIKRPTLDEYFIDMAKLVAKRSTCARRAVGCVLVDKHKHVLATGYNGVPKGFAHCHETLSCPAAKAPSGTSLEGCFAIHAEQNALLQCPDVMQIERCYVTTTPCIHCMKLLLNTSTKWLICAEKYPHTSATELWERANKEQGQKRHLIFVP